MMNQDDNYGLSIGISLHLMFNNYKNCFVIGAVLTFPNGKKLICRRQYESPLNECISGPVISKVGLKRLIWSINKDVKKVFGEGSNISGLDYERIYDHLETGRLNTIMRMKVPVEDDDGEEYDDGYDV